MGRLVGDLRQRTLRFATEAMGAITELPNEARGWIVAKQLGKAATSIGANVWEADAALTEADFTHKISIARKEASETQYWLELARSCELLPVGTYDALLDEAKELTSILATIVRKTQEHLRRSEG
jgi:four helix bundle protein